MVVFRASQKVKRAAMQQELVELRKQVLLLQTERDQTARALADNQVKLREATQELAVIEKGHWKAWDFSSVQQLQRFFGKAFGDETYFARGSFGNVTSFRLIAKLAKFRTNGGYQQSNIEIASEIVTRRMVAEAEQKLSQYHPSNKFVVAPLLGIIRGERMGFISHGLDQSLHDILSRKDWPNIKPVLIRLLAVVQHFHVTLGFVHGDLKPSNIVINNDGSELQFCDLGHTVTVDVGQQMQACGTPAYALPRSRKCSTTKSIFCVIWLPFARTFRRNLRGARHRLSAPTYRYSLV